MSEHVAALEARIEQLKAQLDRYASVSAKIGLLEEAFENTHARAIKAEASLAALRASVEAIVHAIHGVRSPARGYPCWCDNSHNNAEFGHQQKCEAVRKGLDQLSTPIDPSR